MPARWPRVKCHLLTLIGVVCLLPASVEAQTSRGSVTLTGRVSETVVLSVLPNAAHDDVEMNVVSSGNTVRITLSGSNVNPAGIRLPLIVRSNSGFNISATVDSNTTELTQLSVTDVRATGMLVSPAAVNELNIPQQFDLSNVSRPFRLVSGPRVSLGGTLDSPNNALQINLLIRLNPQPSRAWMVHLTFVGIAGPPIQ
jgi:hypothetical protein